MTLSDTPTLSLSLASSCVGVSEDLVFAKGPKGASADQVLCVWVCASPGCRRVGVGAVAAAPMPRRVPQTQQCHSDSTNTTKYWRELTKSPCFSGTNNDDVIGCNKTDSRRLSVYDIVLHSNTKSNTSYTRS